MRILYYDCFAGLSGDMNLAAMINLGVDPDRLRAELAKLGLDHEYELNISPASQHGIHGTRVEVVLKHDGHHAAGHRNLADITAIIRASSLDRAVQDTSLAIFQRLAEAEARVHGTTTDQVHFHEVGATDAVVDIVGAAICRHLLAVDAVWASSVELGSGFVHCAHGLLPVPAPATVEILHGVPTRRGAVGHEATTPTGAAILATLADRFTDGPRMVTSSTGHGIGHRMADFPNVLRVHLAQVEKGRQDARLLQCNIDDMSAEMLGAALDVFMDAGAMDVHFTPILMKKSRPATCLSVFCAAGDECRFTDLIFRHTTTLGVKSIAVDKAALGVRFERVETSLGPVTFKHGLRSGVIVRSKPELEDCRQLSVRHNLPLIEVHARVVHEYMQTAAQQRCPENDQ